MTKFWIEDFSYLFQSLYLIPTCKMDLAEQMNCMTRIVLLIFVILLFTNVSYDILFLATSLLLIICIYYILNKNSENYVEFYGKVSTVLEPAPKIPHYSYTNDFIFYPQTRDPRRPCAENQTKDFPPLGINVSNNNNMIIDNNQSLAYQPLDLPFQDTISLNESIVGPPNPRTLVQPVIPSRIYDHACNDFVVFPGINDQKRQELWQNGYVSKDCRPASRETREDYVNEDTYSGIPIYQNYYNQDNYNDVPVSSVNEACGNNVNNLNYNLPINYQSNYCQRQDDMKEYNKNLFSIPIQPGIYTTSEVNQNDASMQNLGISFTQPFLPTSSQFKNGILEFTQNDPNLVRPVKNPPFYSKNFGQPLRNEIYDPRLTGYGTSYRSYIEPMTGQPRFYYDDIDQYTQSNYITRNNLDIYGFAPQTGVIDQRVLEGDELRLQANNNYTDNQIQFRTELQQRLMNKNNNREWQQRIAPIYTQNSARTSGGSTMSGFYK